MWLHQFARGEPASLREVALPKKVSCRRRCMVVMSRGKRVRLSRFEPGKGGIVKPLREGGRVEWGLGEVRA